MYIFNIRKKFFIIYNLHFLDTSVYIRILLKGEKNHMLFEFFYTLGTQYSYIKSEIYIFVLKYLPLNNFLLYDKLFATVVYAVSFFIFWKFTIYTICVRSKWDI